MAANRKKSGKQHRGNKKDRKGVPAWIWLLSGILIGLGVALALMFNGYLPDLKHPTADSKASKPSEAALIEAKTPTTSSPPKRRYDFFTVLPEMEVVVPDQELSRRAKPSLSATNNNQPESYILQAGSFRIAAEAEQMKARLALLGSMAEVQTVTVNQQTWHRVRLGPFKGARKTDKMRRLLAENQIETLVMKVVP